MKIAMINAWSIGSTGRIMLGCAKAAREKGNEVHVFSKAWIGQNYDSIPNHHVIGDYFWNRVHIKLAKYTGLHGCYSVFTTLKLVKELDDIKPDIIHLHNLHGWFVNLPILFSYIKKNKIPVVWTLHDCWSFTGHCPHFEMEGCSKWKTGCSSCPRFKEYPASNVDCSRFLWNKKRKWFTGLPSAVVVTPSRWLAGLVQQSFLKEYPVKVINNGIDHSVFYPQKSRFRDEYGIGEKYVILGVAFDWGFKKGLDVFIELRNRLDEQYVIVIVGADETVEKQLGPGFIVIQRTANKKELAQIYSAADVFVNPTREDTFPTVNIEALACGTPVITFPTGGSPEIIDSTCGIVTKEPTVNSMLDAILRIQQEKNDYTETMCCRRAKQFDQKVCYESYVALYGDVLKNG